MSFFLRTMEGALVPLHFWVLLMYGSCVVGFLRFVCAGVGNLPGCSFHPPNSTLQVLSSVVERQKGSRELCNS